MTSWQEIFDLNRSLETWWDSIVFGLWAQCGAPTGTLFTRGKNSPNLYPQCKGPENLPKLDDEGFQQIINELVNSLTYALNAEMQSQAASKSFNEMRAMNSIRCAALNFGSNAWNFVAAAYYFLLATAPTEYFNYLLGGYAYYYPYMCSCNLEAEKYMWNNGANAETSVVFSSCTENGQSQYANEQIEADVNLSL